LNARVNADDREGWTPPPLDPETEATLDAMGATRPTRPFDPDWRPVPTRPAWLAFIYRTLGINP
jgi:hypothetical protein